MFQYSGNSELCRKACEFVNQHTELSVREVKTALFSMLMQEAYFETVGNETYPYKLSDDGLINAYKDYRFQLINNGQMADTLKENKDALDELLFSAGADFSHTLPEWDDLLACGYTGMVKKLENALHKENLTDEQREFYACSLSAYRSILVYLSRLADFCDNKGFSGKASVYRELLQHAPKNLEEAFALMVTYYYLQTTLDAIYLRSFGALDRILTPYYERSLQNGVSEEDADSQIREFYLQLRSFGFANNLPFTLGRVTADQKTELCPMSYRLLKLYASMNIQDPKIQIRCSEDVPEDFLRIALDAIRSGNNSIVFMNDRVVLPALMALGIEKADAEDYIPVGCYEPSCRGELACTCSGRVMLPKMVELTLSDGYDAMSGKQFASNPLPNDSWDHFYRNFIDRYTDMAQTCMDMIDAYETYFCELNPSVILAPTFRSAMESGKDLYAGGAKYNSSSINVFGLATVIDSMMAVKELVFEKKELTAGEFAEILRKNWQGYEKFRLKCLKKAKKYGNGDPEADMLTKKVVSDIGPVINGRPNKRGGFFRMGMFSINWHYEVGEKTGATADGRHAGDLISKNMCATIGMDKNGVTGILRSASAADGHQVPNGTVLDLMLDSSAARGEDGMTAMIGIVKAFIASDGTAIQINVLDPEVLKKAKENPDAYRTLQVRLCGWNVYFVDLSEAEQDEFILMAENAAS